MNYENFVKRDDAYKKFVKQRKLVIDSVQKGNFADVFSNLCADALEGDSVAEDCVAYFFNKGISNILQPNYEFYMFWQILAGANGNEFALEKIEFFLNSALEQIVEDTELVANAMRKQKMDASNALMVISNILCEAIIDHLNFDAVDFVKVKDEPSLYSTEKNRPFVDALNAGLVDVVNFLAQ